MIGRERLDEWEVRIAEFEVGEYAITLDGFLIRSHDDASAFATPSYPFQAITDMAGFVMRNGIIEGATGSAVYFPTASTPRCRGCGR